MLFYYNLSTFDTLFSSHQFSMLPNYVEQWILTFHPVRAPQLGAANTPYARSAKPTILQNIALPDPGVIFDSLMARGDTFEPHPNKISSMLFYLATIIIHDIFITVSLTAGHSQSLSDLLLGSQ